MIVLATLTSEITILFGHIQWPYLDTEEHGGSSVHRFGITVGACLPGGSQVHSGNGRKS